MGAQCKTHNTDWEDLVKEQEIHGVSQIPWPGLKPRPSAEPGVVVELKNSSTTFYPYASYLALAHRNDLLLSLFFFLDDPWFILHFQNKIFHFQCGKSREITRMTEIMQFNDEFLYVFYLLISGLVFPRLTTRMTRLLQI